MEPRIELIKEMKLVGLQARMSLADYQVADLWKAFMPKRTEIRNTTTKDVLSLSLYDASYFTRFNPSNDFEKWAAVEVTGFEHIPTGMSTLIVPAGLYAIFSHKGSGSDNSIFQYIYSSWIPASSYQLDDRPHFEVLGEQYRNNDAGSEETIYIPIRPK
ncbi:MAG: GyrI-like domain-containing protein [Proteobacteria bacterium]|nr:GyrI-like domain-containing protein [Pseudomonadota bacterium]